MTYINSVTKIIESKYKIYAINVGQMSVQADLISSAMNKANEFYPYNEILEVWNKGLEVARRIDNIWYDSRGGTLNRI